MGGGRYYAFIAGLAAPALAFLCFAIGNGLWDTDGAECLERGSTLTDPKLFVLESARYSVMLYGVAAVFALATCVAWVNCCCDQYGRPRGAEFEPMVLPAPTAQVPMYTFAPVAATPAAVPPAYAGP